jgi:hypothetical protein
VHGAVDPPKPPGCASADHIRQIGRACASQSAHEPWQLDVQTAFALDDDPGLRVSAGQTHDDLATLDEILAEPDEPVLSHSLAHLAELLRFLAFASNPRPGALRPSDRDR